MQAILDYRAAKVAIETFNQGARGIEVLEKAPELQQILLEMHRAQANADVTMADIMETMRGMDDEHGE